MFSQITEKIVGNMVKQNLIQQENKSIYQYGINQLFNMTLNIITFLIVAVSYDSANHNLYCGVHTSENLCRWISRFHTV